MDISQPTGMTTFDLAPRLDTDPSSTAGSQRRGSLPFTPAGGPKSRTLSAPVGVKQDAPQIRLAADGMPRAGAPAGNGAPPALESKANAGPHAGAPATQAAKENGGLDVAVPVTQAANENGGLDAAAAVKGGPEENLLENEPQPQAKQSGHNRSFSIRGWWPFKRSDSTMATMQNGAKAGASPENGGQAPVRLAPAQEALIELDEGAAAPLLDVNGNDYGPDAVSTGSGSTVYGAGTESDESEATAMAQDEPADEARMQKADGEQAQQKTSRTSRFLGCIRPRTAD